MIVIENHQLSQQIVDALHERAPNVANKTKAESFENTTSVCFLEFSNCHKIVKFEIKDEKDNPSFYRVPDALCSELFISQGTASSQTLKSLITHIESTPPHIQAVFDVEGIAKKLIMSNFGIPAELRTKCKIDDVFPVSDNRVVVIKPAPDDVSDEVLSDELGEFYQKLQLLANKYSQFCRHIIDQLKPNKPCEITLSERDIALFDEYNKDQAFRECAPLPPEIYDNLNNKKYTTQTVAQYFNSLFRKSAK